jgi:hypothetical protein
VEERDVGAQVVALRREVPAAQRVEALLGRVVEGEGDDEGYRTLTGRCGA